MSNPKEFLEALGEFVEYVESLEIRLARARTHIKRNLDKFSPEEIECMVLDRILYPSDVPDHLCTEFVRSLKRRSDERRGYVREGYAGGGGG